MTENKRSLIKVVPTKCVEREVKGKFLSNGKFKVSQGEDFWVDGQLRFPPGEEWRVDGAYRTLFGPCVAHTGVVYCDCNHCVGLAFRRLTAARLRKDADGNEIEDLYYEQLLTDNQTEFFTGERDFFLQLGQRYCDQFESFITIEEAALEHHDDPHIKRALRVKSWEELNESGVRFHRLWLKRVKYKLKRDEIAKPGKVPRMIGDLGVAASLQGFVITKLLKKAQEEHPIHVNGGTIAFCATPAIDKLQAVFDNLLNPPGRFYMAYFSDDSCFSFRHRRKVYYYNLDISKCDASHGPEVFNALLLITPPHLREYVKVLIDQCRLDIVIHSKTDRRHKIVGGFEHPTLYSGSTLTTLINNLANTVIGLCLSRVQLEDRDYEDQELAGIFTAAIEKSGYIVTGFDDKDRCRKPEDLQFLKYSPALDTKGVYRPVLNLGVLLRASGTCKGDLPGRKTQTIESRARHMQVALLKGMYPRTHFPLLNTMYTAAGAETSEAFTKIVSKALQYKVDDTTKSEHYTFSDEAILTRYGLTDLDYAELQQFARSGVYEHSCANFVSSILRTDYGLEALPWSHA